MLLLFFWELYLDLFFVARWLDSQEVSVPSLQTRELFRPFGWQNFGDGFIFELDKCFPYSCLFNRSHCQPRCPSFVCWSLHTLHECSTSSKSNNAKSSTQFMSLFLVHLQKILWCATANRSGQSNSNQQNQHGFPIFDHFRSFVHTNHRIWKSSSFLRFMVKIEFSKFFSSLYLFQRCHGYNDICLSLKLRFSKRHL